MSRQLLYGEFIAERKRGDDVGQNKPTWMEYRREAYHITATPVYL
jgi:hypothetical protein